MPEPLDYLDAPVTALGRAIWPSTLGAVAAGLEHRGGEPVFIKPRASPSGSPGAWLHNRWTFGRCLSAAQPPQSGAPT